MLVAARSPQWSGNRGHDHELEDGKHFSNAGLYKDQKGGLGQGNLSLPTVQGYGAKSTTYIPSAPHAKNRWNGCLDWAR